MDISIVQDCKIRGALNDREKLDNDFQTIKDRDYGYIVTDRSLKISKAIFVSPKTIRDFYKLDRVHPCIVPVIQVFNETNHSGGGLLSNDAFGKEKFILGLYWIEEGNIKFTIFYFNGNYHPPLYVLKIRPPFFNYWFDGNPLGYILRLRNIFTDRHLYDLIINFNRFSSHYKNNKFISHIITYNFVGDENSVKELKEIRDSFHDESASPPQADTNFHPERDDSVNLNPFENAISQLKEGFLNFGCPTQMKLGILSRIFAEIFKGEKFIGDPLAENLNPILVGCIMTVKLNDTNDAFTIKSLNSDSQIIVEDEKTIWNWDVRPIKKGTQKIMLVVSLRLKDSNEGEGVRDYPVFEKVIKVEINNKYLVREFWKKNWQWSIGTLVGAGTIVTILKLLKVIN